MTQQSRRRIPQIVYRDSTGQLAIRLEAWDVVLAQGEAEHEAIEAREQELEGRAREDWLAAVSQEYAFDNEESQC